MTNDEVDRLRHLRASALRVRAVCRALAAAQPHPLVGDRLHRIAGAAWRVSRAASGQLRAHPYATFQKDAGTLTLIANALHASVAARYFGRHARATPYVADQLAALSRQVDDARALTCTPGLSDSLGRSQMEIRGLLGEMGKRGRSMSPLPALVLQPAAGTAVAESPYLNL